MAKKSTRSTTKSTTESSSKDAAAKKTAPVKKKVATAKKATRKTVPAKAPVTAPTPAAKTVRSQPKQATASTPAAQVAPAQPKQATPSASPSLAAPAEPKAATTLSAKVDIGFGNMLYIRGEGPGLNWNRGVPMDCVAADEWVWSTKSARSSFSCKVLINDEIWSTGDDFVVPPGERLVCYPSF